MIIQRSELEQTYLRHQLFELRRDYPGKLETDLVPVPTDGFYDDDRLMVHAPELDRVYELLYPQDTKTISEQVIKIVGLAGLVALWCDCGRSDGKRISFALPRGIAATAVASRWLSSAGMGPASRMISPSRGILGLDQSASQTFARLVYPLAHASMRKGLLRGTR